MGYYTHFKLEVTPDVERVKFDILVAEERLHMSSGYLEYEDIPPLLCGDGDAWKWYDCDADVAAWSKQLPDALFVLVGEGEEQGDTWRLYAKGGEVERIVPEIVWPEPPEWAGEVVGR
jgi:hypothetical protein